MLSPDWVYIWKIRDAYGLTTDETLDLGFRMAELGGIKTPLVRATFDSMIKKACMVCLECQKCWNADWEDKIKNAPSIEDFGKLILHWSSILYEISVKARKCKYMDLLDCYLRGFAQAVFDKSEFGAKREREIDTLIEKIRGANWFENPEPLPQEFQNLFIGSLEIKKNVAIHFLESCGYRLNKEVGGISVALVNRILSDRAEKQETVNGTKKAIPPEVAALYKEKAEALKRGKKKNLLAALYLAQGMSPLEIARLLSLSENPENLPNIYHRAREGRKLAEAEGLPPLLREDSSLKSEK